MRVVVTRAAHQAEELAEPLRSLGAEVIVLPVIGIAPPSNPDRLRSAVLACNSYQWILFSSANAVESFASHLAEPPKARIGAVGSATRQAAEKRGFLVSITPDKYIAEALVEALGDENLDGKRILIPSAAVTRDAIAPALRARGAQVDVVEAYRNVIPPEAAAHSAAVFREPLPDWVIFASSSAVINLAKLVGVETLGRVKIASIGPATSATVREQGLRTTAEALEHSIQGLVEAVSSCGRVHEKI